ncbi:hypothetical protein [Erwinia tasmaniensis]|uniref:Uncharacterized protein n=1 Tax=Erwinia tasmaniensis (strain DSM 17950 / CFBP 7177 / CIP 109463 / NCPPB 4357 / Et1/99) TaxID=465817 RepID=B2VF37_ERWT9|nr:hypothetical protein [Erwinia tasmaniensis]CAO97846.1 hypothetical protein ETA_28000 [Erwinia tasmaniensis Et1/99]
MPLKGKPVINNKKRLTKRVPTGFKLLIFLMAFIVLYFLLTWVSQIIYANTNIWQSAATALGDNDRQGFILLSLVVISLIVSLVFYNVVVRAIERRVSNSS